MHKERMNQHHKFELSVPVSEIAVGEGSICAQFVHRALREIPVPARQMTAA